MTFKVIQEKGGEVASQNIETTTMERDSNSTFKVYETRNRLEEEMIERVGGVLCKEWGERGNLERRMKNRCSRLKIPS